jgi:hypothetical protein
LINNAERQYDTNEAWRPQAVDAAAAHYLCAVTQVSVVVHLMRMLGGDVITVSIALPAAAYRWPSCIARLCLAPNAMEIPPGWMDDFCFLLRMTKP